MIVLKNVSGDSTVDTVFRGRKLKVLPKHSLILKDNEEGKAKAQYLKENFDFIWDITKRIKEEKGGDLDGEN